MRNDQEFKKSINTMKHNTVKTHRSSEHWYQYNFLPFAVQIWRNADIGIKRNSVPDSCCHRPTEGCGANAFAERDDILAQKIYTHGCLTVMGDKLEGQVVPVLLGYAAVGTLLALVQLLCVVFACAYASAISRDEQEGLMLEDEARSYRSSGYNGLAVTPASAGAGGHGSMPGTPRFDHIRSLNHGYGQENANSVFMDDNSLSGMSTLKKSCTALAQPTDYMEKEV